jgi:hypothetical protein
VPVGGGIKMNDIELEIKHLTEAIDILEKNATPHYNADPRIHGYAGHIASTCNIIDALRCQKDRIFNITSRLGIYHEHLGCEVCHPKENQE